MPTTTNYGWTTPADTDLVKDGAAAIRTLGSSIDSTLKTQIDAQIPDSLLTTKGDIIAATGASTPARLAVGTNDQVLIADSTAATGLKWGTPASGGYTLLSTTTLSGSATNITGISQSYTDLLIVLNGVTTATTAGTLTFKFRDSGATDITSTTYATGIQSTAGATGTLFTFAYFSNPVTSSTIKTAAADNAFSLRISDYSESVYGRQMVYSGRYTDGATNNRAEFAVGSVGTAAISGLNLALSAGTFSAGTCKIWGLK